MMKRLIFQPLVWLAAILALGGVLADDFLLRFLAEILIFSIAVMALDIMVGLGGLVSLGHAAIFGGAAYVAAVVAQSLGADLLVVLCSGIAAGAALAALMGLVVVRTVNVFFLILTLICGQLVWELVFHARDVTGGADGLRGLPTLRIDAGMAAWPVDSARALYATVSVVAIGAFAIVRSFVASPIGRALVGSREQPLRMIALGYSISRIRFSALLVSGGIAGAAGSLYPFVNQYIGPNVVHWSTAAMMLIMLVIGGVGSLWGAFVGAAIYLGIQNYLSSYTDRWQLIVGLIFVLTVLMMPNGIANAVASAAARRPQTDGGGP
jgi:branched-chain amino acid transport system permease protein